MQHQVTCLASEFWFYMGVLGSSMSFPSPNPSSAEIGILFQWQLTLCFFFVIFVFRVGPLSKFSYAIKTTFFFCLLFIPHKAISDSGSNINKIYKTASTGSYNLIVDLSLWGCSTRRALAQHAWSPGFSSQHYTNQVCRGWGWCRHLWRWKKKITSSRTSLTNYIPI